MKKSLFALDSFGFRSTGRRSNVSRTMAGLLVALMLGSGIVRADEMPGLVTTEIDAAVGVQAIRVLPFR